MLSALGVRKLGKNTILSDGTKNIIAAMETHGVKRLVCMTSLGVGDSKDQPTRVFRAIIRPLLLRNEFIDKEEQERLIKASKLDWIIVRPTGLTNGPHTGTYEHWVGEPKSPITNRISRADVGDFMLKQLMEDTYLHKTPGQSRKVQAPEALPAGDIQFSEVVFPAELQEIEDRRERLSLPPVTPIRNPAQIAVPNPKLGLVGLALSGGGVRSATFNLGILQALADCDLLKWVDYLSTVSGGGYIGSCVSNLLNCSYLDTTKEKFPLLPENTRPIAVRQLEESVAFLAPDGDFGKLVMASALLEGMLFNAVLMTPYVILLALATYFTGYMFYPSIGKTEGWVPILTWIPVNPQTTPLSSALVTGPFLVYVLICASAALSFGVRRNRASSIEEIPGVRFAIVLIVGAMVFVAALQPWAVYYFEAQYRTSPLRPLTILLFPLGVALLAASFGKARPASSTVIMWSIRIFVLMLLYLFYLSLSAWTLFSPVPSIIAEMHPSSRVSPVGTWTVIKLAMLFGSMLITYRLWRFVNINRTGMHDFYRIRLSKAYLFRQTSDHKIVPITSRHAKLSNMGGAGSSSPVHIINVALNLHASEEAAKQREPSDSFIFSKLFTGSSRTGYVPTPIMEEADPAMDLGAAMATSGAAVSPNMGVMTARPLVAFLTLLNVRLGYWLPNPARLTHMPFMTSTPGPIYFVKEMFSRISERGEYVYLTDGGHRENLGVLELIRRQCSLIVVGDAEADPMFSFSGLRRVIYLAGHELGAAITFDEAHLQEIANSHRHYAVGTITYDNGGTAVIVYLKASLTHDEGALITGYKRDNKAFPHDPTSEQFFTDLQFHCYRTLGFHVGSTAFKELESYNVDSLLSAEYREAFVLRSSKWRTAVARIMEGQFPESERDYLLKLAFRIAINGDYNEVERELTRAVRSCHYIKIDFGDGPLDFPSFDNRMVRLKGIMILIRAQAPGCEPAIEMANKIAKTDSDD